MVDTPGESSYPLQQTGEQSDSDESRPDEEAEAIAGTPPEQSEPLFPLERFRNVREEVVGGYHEEGLHDSPVSRRRHVQDGRDSPTGPTASPDTSPKPLNGREESGESRGEAVDGYHEATLHDSPVSHRRHVQGERDSPIEPSETPDTPKPLNGQERSGGGGVEAVEGYHEDTLHDSPVEGQHRNRTHRGQNSVRVGGESHSVETVVDVERIKRQNRGVTKELMVSLDDSTRKGILSALLTASPRTYDELETWSNKSKRTIKKYVFELEDAGVLEVEEGRPSTVAFRDDDIRLIASDVLSYL